MNEIIDLYKDGEYLLLGLVIVAVLFVVLSVLALSLLAADYISGSDKTIQVTVLEKLYIPSRTTSGTGVGLGMDGKMGIISTSSHENEKFNLLVKDEDGEAFTFSADPTLYSNAKIGEKIEITIRIGGISKGRI